MPSKANENSKWKQSNCLKRGKNAGDQDVFGFSFASDWLREWREFFFYQSKSEVKQKKKPIPDFFRHSLENCSIVTKLSQKYFMIVVLSLSSLQLSASFSHVPVLYLFVLLFHRLEACLLLRQSERNVSGIRLQLSSFRTFNSRIAKWYGFMNSVELLLTHTGWLVSFRSSPCGRCPTVSMLDAGRVIVFLGTTLLPSTSLHLWG